MAGVLRFWPLQYVAGQARVPKRPKQLLGWCCAHWRLGNMPQNFEVDAADHFWSDGAGHQNLCRRCCGKRSSKFAALALALARAFPLMFALA